MSRRFITTSPASRPEIINITLSETEHPTSYKRKVEDLLRQGFSEVEINKIMDESIELELIYDPGQGLFAVESEAIADGALHSPYSQIEILEDNT